jgi:hypothetical protein
LLNGFDRDRFIASAAIGSLSALPASGLFGRQATESLCLFALLCPAQLDGAAAFDRHRILGGINGRFAPILLKKSKIQRPRKSRES